MRDIPRLDCFFEVPISVVKNSSRHSASSSSFSSLPLSHSSFLARTRSRVRFLRSRRSFCPSVPPLSLRLVNSCLHFFFMLMTAGCSLSSLASLQWAFTFPDCSTHVLCNHFQQVSNRQFTSLCTGASLRYIYPFRALLLDFDRPALIGLWSLFPAFFPPRVEGFGSSSLSSFMLSANCCNGQSLSSFPLLSVAEMRARSCGLGWQWRMEPRTCNVLWRQRCLRHHG